MVAGRQSAQRYESETQVIASQLLARMGGETVAVGSAATADPVGRSSHELGHGQPEFTGAVVSPD